MTADDVRKILQRSCDRVGSQTAWAVSAGVSLAYVCDVLAGRREPGESILKPLGLERVTIYRKVKP